jgi:hypothetical protein
MGMLHSATEGSRPAGPAAGLRWTQAAMMRLVRPSTPEDAPAILALFAEAGLRPNVRPPELHWKYWEPRADWPGPRSFVLTHHRELVAHSAIVPGSCAWVSGQVTVIHMIDWAARPAAAGAGVTLMKHIGQQAQALLAIGGSTDTLRILPQIGFHDVGAATGYVRTLLPWRLRGAGGAAKWRLLPRLARRVAWTLGAPAARVSDWQARRLGADEVGQLAAVLPAAEAHGSVMSRSVELLRHMLSCPIVPLTLFAVERAGLVRGYFLLAAAPGQVRIADCAMASGDPAEWRAMILCAVAQARSHRPAEVVTLASHPLLRQALEAGGFHARFRIPVRMRTSSPATARPPAPLHVQMLDSDAAFFHAGRSEPWA